MSDNPLKAPEAVDINTFLEQAEEKFAPDSFIVRLAKLIQAVPAVSKPLNPGKSFMAELASSVVAKRVEWLWPSRIPLGKLTIFAGNPDQGKSVVSLDVAARLSTGAPWADCENTNPPGETLVIASEDDAQDTLKPRLMAAGADCSKIRLFRGIALCDASGNVKDEQDVSLDRDITVLDGYLAEHPAIRLVIIDPVSNHLGSANMNKEQEVRRVLASLKPVAERRKAAIVGIMHFNKNQEGAAIHRIGGAMAFAGVARAVWIFAPDTDIPDRHLMLPLKNNLTAKRDGLGYRLCGKDVSIAGNVESLPTVEWDGVSGLSADAALVSQLGRPSGQLDSAKEWLENYLDATPKSAVECKEAAEAAGIKPRTLERAKAMLNVKSVRLGDTWHWYRD